MQFSIGTFKPPQRERIYRERAWVFLTSSPVITTDGGGIRLQQMRWPVFVPVVAPPSGYRIDDTAAITLAFQQSDSAGRFL